MEKILFLNRKTASDAEVRRLSDHTMLIQTEAAVNTSGFLLVTETGAAYGKYEDYTTLYREVEGGFILSNDGSVYVEPEPQPEPEPYMPTFEEVRQQKLNELSAACHESIINGVVIGGLVYRYDYEHQMNIEKIFNTVKLTGLPIGFKADNEDCREYTASEISNIYIQLAMNQYSNQTYFNQVSAYLNSLEENEANRETIQNYTYGTELAGEYLEHYNKMVELYQTQISAASPDVIS